MKFRQIMLLPHIKIEFHRKLNFSAEMEKVETYLDFYEYLRKQIQYPSIIPFLKNRVKGIEKQEILLRLFARLRLFHQFDEYQICSGKFSGGDVFVDNDIQKFLQNSVKDKGDKSDLTLLQGNEIIATTSKNLNEYHINKLDLRDISDIYSRKFKDKFSLRYCIVARDKVIIENLAKNAEKSSADLIEIIQNPSTIILDWNDINLAFRRFALNYRNFPPGALNSGKVPLNLKFHQELTINKTLKLIKNGVRNILWGHIPRSGKSYCMAGLILKDKIGKNKCNYLILTTAPNETIGQYIKIFSNATQFIDFKIHRLSGENTKPILGSKNIIICSKQFLQPGNGKKSKKIGWLSDIKIEMRFIDESHQGGTTKLAEDILSIYGKKCITIYLTATYGKPVDVYNIGEKAQILWDLEDVRLCKTVTKPESLQKLKEKHGNISDLLKIYTPSRIESEYQKYPELQLLTWSFKEEVKKEILAITGDTDYGFSTRSLFLLKNDEKGYKNEFANEDHLLRYCRAIFGYKLIGKSVNRPGTHYDFISRIKEICSTKKSIGSRTFSKSNPLIILCFLPCGDMPINALSQTFQTLLEREKVLPNFEIVCINSGISGDPKSRIDSAYNRAKNTDKEGVLVLSGKQCSLGITLEKCDVVMLMNNTKAMDQIYQMMFRSMTEDKGKTIGFVVDLNIQRAVNTLVDYSLLINKKMTVKEALRYILMQRLITPNCDDWMPCFNGHLHNLDKVITESYKIYMNDPIHNIGNIINMLKRCPIDLDTEKQQLINTIFKANGKSHVETKKNMDELAKILEGKDKDIKDGVEKIAIETGADGKLDTEKKPDTEEAKIIERVNFMNDVLVQFVPLACILTAKTDDVEFDKICEYINENQEIKSITLAQMKLWWDKEIPDDVFKLFVDFYAAKCLDKDSINRIIKLIKELFSQNIENQKVLSELIDKYLVPQELEKKTNAEISTPRKLRQEMLDVIPREFWTKIQFVFEPCCGKGGFLIDIVERFMNGLKELYKDSGERYKMIVETCLYFSDINPINIFICKLLLDPFGKYNLNYHIGDTLKLDISRKWMFEKMDAVIGNPPYSTDPSKQDAKPIYNLFVEKFIDSCNYLLFVTPSRWFVGGKGLDSFRKNMIKRRDISVIIHQLDAHKWFGNNVDIKGGVSYFLKDSNYNGPSKFNEVKYYLDKYDSVIDPAHHNFIDKICKFDSITKLYYGRHFGYRTNDKRLKLKGEVKCFVSSIKNKSRVMYTDNYEFAEKDRFWKVITARASHGSHSGFGIIFIGSPEEMHTDSYISFKTQNENEAKSLLSYMNCKLPNYALSIRKISQDINENVCLWIPLVPLNRIWNDKAVFDYFKLSESERKKIIEIAKHIKCG